MQRAYILIETVQGKSGDVANALRQMSGITMANIVTGQFDVIAVAQCPDTNVVARLVLNEVRNIPGVYRTLTCLAVEN